MVSYGEWKTINFVGKSVLIDIGAFPFTFWAFYEHFEHFQQETSKKKKKVFFFVPLRLEISVAVQCVHDNMYSKHKKQIKEFDSLDACVVNELVRYEVW